MTTDRIICFLLLICGYVFDFDPIDRICPIINNLVPENYYNKTILKQVRSPHSFVLINPPPGVLQAILARDL